MNPFEKYLGKEQHLHIQICRYISAQYPDALFCHPMNEGRRTKYERFLAKILSMKAGIPDLLLFEPRGNYCGLAIELKIKNILTDSQKKWLSDLSYRYWRTEVVYDFETGKKVIDEYLKQDKAKNMIRTWITNDGSFV